MDLLKQIKATGKARIKDEGKVAEILKGLQDGGNRKLQLIVDFDYTLTRVHKNGKRLHVSWAVFETSSFVPKSYLEKTNALRNKYLPIEQDAHMTIEEKTPYMIEWWTTANSLLSEIGTVKRDTFPLMVKDSNVELREGTQEMMRHLKDRDVPVLVLSAGLGDMVHEIMKELDALHSNVHIVSNFLSFDQEGNIAGMASDMIHVFNKNEKSLNRLASEEFYEQIHARHNVILMGDSLGDIGMANGVDSPESVLKIGFLNHGETSDEDKVRLNKYLDAYDIVLVDDQTMDVANVILKGIKA